MTRYFQPLLWASFFVGTTLVCADEAAAPPVAPAAPVAPAPSVTPNFSLFKAPTLHLRIVADETINENSVLIEYDIRKKGELARAEMTVAGVHQTFIDRDKACYSYIDGSATGLILNPGVAGSQIAVAALMDMVVKGGKQIGTEKVEGEDCAIYEQEIGTTLKQTVWVSLAKGWPVKSVSTSITPDTKVVSVKLYKDIEVNPELADDLFKLPEDLTFAEPPAAAN